MQELIVPTEDGTIHAYEPDGSELPGWPVHTGLQQPARGHDSAPGFAAAGAGTPPREPPRGADDRRPRRRRPPRGRRHAPAPTSTPGSRTASPLPGFPVAVEPRLLRAQRSRAQPLDHPKCGFLASPAVGHLEGPTKPLDIVAPALDGHLYAFDGDGNPLPGFPVALVDPGVPANQQMIAESINEPAIGDLNGDGKRRHRRRHQRDLRRRPAAGGDVGALGRALTDLLAGAAGGSSRVYAVNGANGKFLPGWPIKLNGRDPGHAAADRPRPGPGDRQDRRRRPAIVASTTGSATIEELRRRRHPGPRASSRAPTARRSDATDRSGTINLFESAVDRRPAPAAAASTIVKYGLSLSDVANLLLIGQNVPYNHLIGAYDAPTGAPLPAFPRITDDFQFLSSSDIAQGRPGAPRNQVSPAPASACCTPTTASPAATSPASRR